MEKIAMYKTFDSKLFEDESFARNHEELILLGEEYSSGSKILSDTYSVGLTELKEYLEDPDNRNLIKKIIFVLEQYVKSIGV